MMSTAPRIALVFCSLLLANTSEAFTASTNPTRCPVRPHAAATSAQHDGTTKNNEDERSGGGWTLEQDWALMDRVPAYTVGESDEMKRTFWTQLWISTPALSGKASQDDLFRRYQDISKSQTLPTAGPSPLILQDWSMKDNGRVTGQLGGRTVWFVAHVVGQMEDDPSSKSQAGGFIEAVGGRVYELGCPRVEEDAVRAFGSTSSGGSKEEEDEGGMGLLKNPLFTGATATMSALIASTVLSAAIGYGAGLSIISDSPTMQTSSAPATMAPTQTVKVVRSPTSTRTEASVAEKRARKEAQIFREERLVQSITEKMGKDRVELQKLIQEEKVLMP